MLFPEANKWRAGMQAVSAAIDDTMGEAVTVTPAQASKPNFAAVPDPSRAVTTIAVFTNKAETVIMGSEGRMGGHSVSPLVTTSKPIFSFSSGALPFPILQGYRITRLCSGDTYEAKDVKPDGVARIVVSVAQIGRAQEDV